jgi:Fic family protein
MKIPEKAPDWQSILQENKESLFAHIKVLEPVIKKADSEYLYWDRFKYLAFPPAITPEKAWTVLKLSRVIRGVKSIPLADREGKNFTYWIPDSAQKALHFLDQNTAGQILIDEPALQSEEKQRYILKSIIEEAITSSQLEGAATTRVVAKEMLRSGRQPANHAERMIFNNYITITKIRDYVQEPLSAELLLEFHRLISKETLETPEQEGRFRRAADGDIRVYDEKDQVLHTPPPPEIIDESIRQLCNFANEEDGEEFVHPVIRGIILHFWLAYLHPFVDGNGRTARALFYWFLLKRKYWLFEYLSISKIMRRASIQYYRSFLYAETDDRDMTYFIMFHLRAIKLAVDELRLYLQAKQKESRNALQLLRKQPHLNHRQRALLASALKHPDTIFTFTTHMRTHGVVYQTARADLLGLHALGLLEMHKSGKKFHFVTAPDLASKLR